jgi:sulfatase modifying factor 1
MLLLLGVVTSAMLAWGQTGEKSDSVDKPTAKAEKQAAQDQPRNQPKTFTNSIGMKFAWIPAGTFVMGSPPNEEGVVRSENSLDETQHKVTLTKGFYIGVHLVTQEQWQAVMGDNPSQFKGEKNLPVENVSWNDCQEFIKRLREKDKWPYRLPTEAEWEFACRAGTTTPFHFGESISTDQANFNGTSYNGTSTNGRYNKGVNRQKTTPVNRFPANAWGLHDMHGNLWQWCQDWFGDYAKNDGVDPQGPDTGDSRVLRGGSWLHYPASCTSGRRNRHVPDTRSGTFGFRLCYFVVKSEDTPKPPVD